MPLLRCCACVLFALLSVFGVGQARADEPVRVFAAASLTNALEELATQWQAAGHARPVLAFGASSTLAKQVEAGAPADLFASADQKWMDHVAKAGRIAPESRVALLGNTLVLIAPRNRAFTATLREGAALATRFRGKLCTGEPGVVPVGIYAQQALTHVGAWDALQGRIVGTDDVRTALAFVERGECGAGVVYATDARISQKVRVVATFPAGSHAPIVYPVALTRDAPPQARAFLAFLRGPAAAKVFLRHGFTRGLP